MTQPEERGATLAKVRNLKMARSAHAYVRGSTVEFYQALEAGKHKIPSGPPVWICGDCHVGNLGPIADAKGRVAIQIRDLDQTVIGNPAHDLIRLGLSLASAARGSDLPGVTTAKILEELVSGYQNALVGDYSTDADRSYRPKPMQSLLARSVQRKWRHLAEERLADIEPLIPLGKRFWALTPEERKALSDLFDGETIHQLITALRRRENEAPVQLVDAAYWLKGCSSLGRLRYAVLLRVGEGADAEHCLVDIKEGVTPAAPRAPDVKMPKDNAVRVVKGARALSPNLGSRMIAARVLDRAVVIRELMPQDLKIEVNQLTQSQAMQLARYLAGVVGRAHGRQLEGSVRQAWLADLTKNHTATLDAPSWLWTSVVDLVGFHEKAYLEHCRKFAAMEAA